MNAILQILATLTDTKADDWEIIDGPDSGCGIDYWLRHEKSGREAYANLDQEYLTISVNGECVYEGPLSQPF